MARPRGPAPQDPHLALMRGNPGKRKPRESLKLSPRAPSEPRWPYFFPGRRDLAAIAKATWHEVVPALDALGILSPIDRGVLTVYCVCTAQLAEANRLVAEQGMVVDGDRAPKRNPALVIANQLRNHLRLLVGDLGLSPASRLRFPMPPPPDDPDDPWGSGWSG